MSGLLGLQGVWIPGTRHSGLKRISKECAASGVRVEFKVLKSGFLLTLHRKPAEKPVRGTVVESVVKTGEKGWERLGGKFGERFGERFGETGLRVLSLIQRDKHITIKSLSLKLGISTRAIEKNLAMLKRRGVLRRVGSDKSGYWELVE